ncbi:YceI-like domain-containing protein [Mariprofundus ferrinatatus]|uniref:YceI-like domain-containing protein n=1 Tax=Mariprofundus ferrinatatus TaxID=1921087 RepID=A0A2K8LA11_9PROT|nr:YceI family protein [Mariprofundus ferrinatatus]ATX82741.1 YceI-like domain-containing protein [Mariprofundus ferrinatatus]
MRYIMLLALMMLPATLWAGSMKLDGTASDINFVSVKKESVAEVHHFTALSGSIEGKAGFLLIDLASIESGIDIRNERMRSMLFEVARFSSASIKADLSAIAYDNLKAGERISATLPLALNLHGVRQTLAAEVDVVKLGDERLLVASRQPVIVKAGDFEMEGGIEALRQVANLPGIARVVPVNFHLIFTR